MSENILLTVKKNRRNIKNYEKLSNANKIGISEGNFLYSKNNFGDDFLEKRDLELVDITYNHTSNPDYLSNGDIFYQCFTCFIMVEILNYLNMNESIYNVLYHDSWKYSNIITNNSYIENCISRDNKNQFESLDSYESYDYIFHIKKYNSYKSLPYEELLSINNQINLLGGKVKVIIENICHIKIHFIYDWYQNKLINNDIYSHRILPKLHQLYYFDQNENVINEIAIHIRVGDLSKWTWEIGLNLEYYTNIINLINENLNNIPINIYYEGMGKDTTYELNKKKNKENFNYDWLLELSKLKNVNLKEGNLDNCVEQFNELARSKVLILSPSSYSLFAGFINKSKNKYIDIMLLKERPNIFENIDGVPDFILYSNFSDVVFQLKNQFD